MHPGHLKKRTKTRRGAAVVEFAIALPPLFLIIFGAIEACNAIFLHQFLTEVSYEGAISASRLNVTEATVVSNMNNLLQARGISGATVSIVGTGGEAFDTLTADQLYKVSVTVPAEAIHAGPSIAPYVNLRAEAFGRHP